MNIIQMKQAIKDIRTELAAEIDKGMEMAKNRATTLESIKAQSDKVDDLQIREALLVQALNTAEGKENPLQSKKLGQNGGFRSLGEFASAVHNACTLNGTVDSRLVRNDASGANETTGADGGYLVPPDYAAGVIDLIQEQSILLPQARRVTIAGNRLIEAYLVESKRDDGHRHGGVLAYWKGEAQQYKSSKPTFGERTTQLDKLTAICPVTEELLMDEPAIESTLDTKVAQEFAWKADAAIFNGSGSGSMPLGMVMPTTNTALVTVDKESGQAAGTVNVQNILKMWNRMPAQCRANAKWYINQDLELQLMQLMMGTDTVATSDSGVTVSFGGPLCLPVRMVTRTASCWGAT